MGRSYTRTAVLAAVGIALGIAAAAALGRAISGLIYGVGATDLPSFAGAALLLFTTALAASYFPARRASGVDPVVALRRER